MHWVVRVLSNSAKELVVFNALAAAFALSAFLLFPGDPVSYFGLIVLFESVALMLVGGALDFSSSRSMREVFRQFSFLLGKRAPPMLEEQTKEQLSKVGVTAATYAVTGVLLFMEAGLLAVVLV